MKNLKKEKLYEYLDGYHFVNYWEIEGAIADYFCEELELFNPWYGDLFFFHDLAIQYCSEKNFEFEKDIVDWIDLNDIDWWKKEILDYRISTWLIIPSKE